jgi:hypothetical protein
MDDRDDTGIHLGAAPSSYRDRFEPLFGRCMQYSQRNKVAR